MLLFITVFYSELSPSNAGNIFVQLDVVSTSRNNKICCARIITCYFGWYYYDYYYKYY